MSGRVGGPPVYHPFRVSASPRRNSLARNRPRWREGMAKKVASLASLAPLTAILAAVKRQVAHQAERSATAGTTHARLTPRARRTTTPARYSNHLTTQPPGNHFRTSFG